MLGVLTAQYDPSSAQTSSRCAKRVPRVTSSVPFRRPFILFSELIACTGEKDLEETIAQLLMAVRSTLVSPPKELCDWTKARFPCFFSSLSCLNLSQAILVTTQIVQGGQATADDLESLLNNGKLESRGLYNNDELTTVPSKSS